MSDLEVAINPGNVPDQLGAIPEEVRKALVAEAKGTIAQLLATMRAKAGGGVLKVRSGEYLESFKGSVRETQTGVTARAGTHDPLANILEHGGHLPPHLIKPKNARALHFLPTSGEVFAAAVHFPGAELPAFSVVGSTFEEAKSGIEDRMVKAVETAQQDHAG